MNSVPPLTAVCPGKDGVGSFDVVFVHGLTGDPQATWQCSSGQFWPSWLCDELPEAQVYTLGYPTSFFEKWAKKEMNIHERAQNLLEALTAQGLGQKPIAFVCHSLGGLLVKEILRVASECDDKDWQKILLNNRANIFLATPHTGASLASVIKLVAPRISSQHVELLSNESGFLTSLNQSYRDLASKNGFHWPAAGLVDTLLS